MGTISGLVTWLWDPYNSKNHQDKRMHFCPKGDYPFFKIHKIKDNLFTIFKICQSYDLPKTFRKLECLKFSYSSKKPCL